MMDRVGQRLGNYRLVRLLGKGGFAEVYLGEHVRLDTQAALKVLHTKLASEEEVESFQQEAKTIAKLVHPHIVRVLDFDVQEGTPFLVMDYAPNGTLRQKHPKGTRLSPHVILPYIKQAAEALQYAHERKLIHRDIKPENLLLGEHDAILLSDFGIALVAQSSLYQNTQEVVGTMAYMAPEQLQGHPRPASDQYALAITAYEWLRGDRPFHGSFSEIFSQQMFVAPAPLRTTLPELAPVIEEVILTALAKDPKERFASARAFANAFEQACQGAALHFAPTLHLAPSGHLAQPTSVIPPTEPPASRQNAAVTSTPPGWRDIPMAAPSGPATRMDTRSPSTPPSGAGVPAPPIKAETKSKRRGPRRTIIVGSLVFVLMLVIAGGTWAILYHPPTFHQQITTGPDITSIQVGTGVDASGHIQGVADTFKIGTLVYVFFTDPLILNTVSVDVQLTYHNAVMGVGYSVGLIGGSTDVYDTSALVTGTGIYEWSVLQNGAVGASITFQVVS